MNLFLLLHCCVGEPALLMVGLQQAGIALVEVMCSNSVYMHLAVVATLEQDTQGSSYTVLCVKHIIKSVFAIYTCIFVFSYTETVCCANWSISGSTLAAGYTSGNVGVYEGLYAPVTHIKAQVSGQPRAMHVLMY